VENRGRGVEWRKEWKIEEGMENTRRNEEYRKVWIIEEGVEIRGRYGE